jgi:hypothetical protein
MTRKIVFCLQANEHDYNMGIRFLSSFLRKSGVDVRLVIYCGIDGKVKYSPEASSLDTAELPAAYVIGIVEDFGKALETVRGWSTPVAGLGKALPRR